MATTRKTKRLHVAVTPSERADWKRAAKARKMRLSTWVRLMLNDAAVLRGKDER